MTSNFIDLYARHEALSKSISAYDKKIANLKETISRLDRELTLSSESRNKTFEERFNLEWEIKKEIEKYEPGK